jgi:hypothetical protein
MKLFNYILMAGAVGMFAASCTHEEKDIFEDSAAQRMNKNVVAYTELLESADQGWVFNYFPGADGETAGVAMTVRFKEGVSYFRSSFADDEQTEVGSLYQVKAETECMLSFDTYNEVFHCWSEPLGSTAVDGYQGDYEFMFKRISDNQDTIVVKGKRYGNYGQLIRLHSDGAEYMKLTKACTRNIDEVYHRAAVVGADSINARIKGGVLTYYVTTATPTTVDPDATTTTTYTVPYVQTPTGFHLYKAVTLGGQTFQDCTYDSTTYLVKAENANLTFPRTIPAYHMTYDDLLGTYSCGSTMENMHTVTVTAKVQGKSYNIKGLSNHGTLEATYAEGAGSFQIMGGQYLGSASLKSESLGVFTGYFWWCSYYDGYVSWSPSYGMVGENTMKDGKINIVFESINSTNVTTFMEYVFSTEEASSSSTVGYWEFYDEPLTLVKK